MQAPLEAMARHVSSSFGPDRTARVRVCPLESILTLPTILLLTTTGMVMPAGRGG